MANEREPAAGAQGGCLCGAIRYRVTRPIEKLILCHCTDCQKASATGASVNAVIPSDRFEIVQGTPKVFSRVVDSGNTLHRAFCGDCGSPIYTRRANAPQVTVLKVGTLDAPIAMKVAMNIWTDSARPWMHIDTTLENHPKGRPVPPAAPPAASSA